MVKSTWQQNRQRVRKALLLLAVIAFPVTIYYFSPYLILMGAAEGVINGSFVVFGLLLLSATVVGRLWCGWLCPAGGMQELAAMRVNKKRVNPKLRWVKWGIWVPWLFAIAGLAIRAGGYRQVNLLYQLERGNSMNSEGWVYMFPLILLLMLVPAALIGRRASCHWLCWMAPFMILGRELGQRLGTPQLQVRARPDACIECGRCTRDCPMSVEVQAEVPFGRVRDSECILCGTCVDNCPEGVLSYHMRPAR
jgi:ferredoxin-type protein NapH